MIPKRIHYCWFGRAEMPRLLKKCLRSWEKYCPDWEIIRWDEDSFDVNSTLWTKQAYEANKYAFVADYVRILALAEQGGVYLDTDQELIKPLEPFLHHRAFMGFMAKDSISAGVIGAEKGHPMAEAMLCYYQGRAYCCEGQQDDTPNTDLFTDYLLKNGLVMDDSRQEIAGVSIYPQTYFCPTSCISYEDCTSKDTVSLHHWAMSWRTAESRRNMRRNRRRTGVLFQKWERIKLAPKRILRRIVGDEIIDQVKERLHK